MTSSENGPQTLLTVEEQVDVAKRRQVTGTVRARTLSHEWEQPVETDLSVETLEVERVPIGRFVDGPIPNRQDGDTTVISVIEEVAIVEVRLKLVEEVRITRRTESRRMTEHVTLRRQDVVIDQDPAPNDPEA
ncbi:YsnF/AvaK domain-containing protein [Azospirillum sp. A1-3]|uniref:YsnF/AvaK domain-containing protein n=1 Tax=Azospirillum sp. A1-3 TaxID=185874 RepID=UPI0020776876|nr:YsnF/AvaK domain-containing protein [Azospirillum sp. A1-3]MCM8735473.1 YsnF/AvaK domain-containing protein [Azospirillum sp. A1-3]